ncbi:MAG: hypothetical protein ABWZ99_07110 [Ilumatobacteraceae bacterium]
MSRTHRVKAAVGVVLILIGVGFGLLAKEWIEETFGFEPDGGNGALELALVVIPIAIGVWLLVGVALANRRQRAAQTITRDR